MIEEFRNKELKSHNTFGFDVRCDRFVEYGGIEDLRDIFAGGTFAGGRWDAIGSGSNIVFTRDYKGTLLHSPAGVTEVVASMPENVRVRAGAGMEWDCFTRWCAENGFWGVENLTSIPGTVGASPVQNIGAYGAEVGDVIESVETFCVDSGKTLTLSRDYCGFGYRESVFKGALKGKVIITAVNFVLSRKPQPKIGYGELGSLVEEYGGPSLENIRSAVSHIRSSKLPDPRILGNAGSFFRNPVVEREKAQILRDIYPEMPVYSAGSEGYAKISAGWLIEKCGWKGRREGNVGVHERQALVLVNYGGGNGRDIVTLAGRIQSDISEKFGIVMDMEVVIK